VGKTVVRMGIFMALLGIILATANKVFAFKYIDGISNYTTFYAQEDDTVDVLILGSSCAFVNFNNGTLYEDYGIASYTLGGAIQTMWNSYFALKEALKTQKPELIVLEGFCLQFASEYSDDSRIIKNTYGMKWSANKIEAIKVSSEKERVWEFMIDYAQYHTRYTELEKGDFISDLGSEGTDNNWFGDSWKGQYLMNKTVPQTFADVSTVNYEKELYSKTEEYYRKTIELAQENDIPITIVVVPQKSPVNTEWSF
jgi:hypothetical protein